MADQHYVYTGLDEWRNRSGNIIGGIDPPTEKPLIGANVGSDPRIFYPGYENCEVARVFVPGGSSVVGQTFLGISNIAKAYTDMGIKTLCISSKDTNGSGVAAFLETRPSDCDVYWVYAHEPENDNGSPGSAAYNNWATAWRNNWATVGPAVRAAGAFPMSILMSWTLNPNSGRTLTEWTPPPGAVDVFGFDGYMEGSATAAGVLGGMLDAAASRGLPTAVGETGRVRDNLPQQVNRAETMRALALSQSTDDLKFVCWWNHTVSQENPVPPEHDGRFATSSTPTNTSNAWWGI